MVLKDTSSRLTAFQIMAFRNVVAAVLVVAIVLVVQPSAFTADMSTRTWVLLLGSAGIVVLGDVAFLRAIAVDDVSRAFTVTTSLYIIMSVAGGIAFLGDPFSWGLVAGGIAVLAGARLVMNESASDRASTRKRKPLFTLWMSTVAALLWSVSLLAVSDALDSVNAWTAAGLRTPFEVMLLMAIVLVRGDIRTKPLSRSDARTLALSGAVSLGAMLTFLYAAQEASAGVVAILGSTSPIFAVPMAWFLVQERITARVVGGTAICMVGIWLTSL